MKSRFLPPYILTGLPLHKTAAVPPTVTNPLDRNTFQRLKGKGRGCTNKEPWMCT